MKVVGGRANAGELMLSMAKWTELLGTSQSFVCTSATLGPFNFPCTLLSVGIVQAPRMLGLL